MSFSTLVNVDIHKLGVHMQVQVVEVVGGQTLLDEPVGKGPFQLGDTCQYWRVIVVPADFDIGISLSVGSHLSSPFCLV